jgi:hypothetical protein
VRADYKNLLKLFHIMLAACLVLHTGTRTRSAPGGVVAATTGTSPDHDVIRGMAKPGFKVPGLGSAHDIARQWPKFEERADVKDHEGSLAPRGVVGTFKFLDDKANILAAGAGQRTSASIASASIVA